MIYKTSDIIQTVRVCLDENRIDAALFAVGDEETLQLDDVIRSKIEESVDMVHKKAPYYMLEQGHNLEETDEVGIHWEGEKPCGWLLLPDDFMRLVVFEMSDWERPVYSMIMPGTTEYRRQRSRQGGVRGTVQRPVCVYGVRPYGRVMEFYSCKNQEATVTQGVYIPHAKIEIVNGVESIDISKQCYTAMVYMVAGLTLATRGEKELSEEMIKNAERNLE